MKNKIIFSLLLLAPSVSAQQIVIDANIRHQTIEGFGASDAWSTEVLKSFPEDKRNTAAKWLFDSGLKNGKTPNGIGLSIWRFALGPFGNMPAGSSSIPQDYLDGEGNYVWDVNPGKQWFLEKAASYGCNQFGAWSACILPQLRPDGLNREAFRRYGLFLADVLDHYEQQGVQFKYIAPVNEPQYTWVEGVKWTTSNIAQMTREVCNALIERGNSTPVILGECADWSNLYDSRDTEDHWARNQVFAYFDKLSVNYLGDLPNLMPELGVHSYWTDQDSVRLNSMRSLAKGAADKYGLKLHQTEWSLLSNPPIEGLPASNVSDMDIALITSKVIHSDLHYAGVSSWCFWEAFGAGAESHFHLIQTDEMNKNLKARKNLWVLGNYSLFIRPGYQRVEMKGASALKSLMGTSYISPDGSKLVSVYTNISYEKKSFTPEIKLPEGYVLKSVRKYQTTSLLDLQFIPVNLGTAISVPARSVVTMEYELEVANSIESVIPDANSDILFNYIPGTTPRVKIRSNGESEFQICSVNGTLLISSRFFAECSYELPSTLQNGIYIIKITNDKQQYVTKFLVKN